MSKEEITQIPRLGPSKTHKVITTLEEQGFSFMNTKYLKNVTLSLAYFKIETLNLEEKTLNKLKENDIFNLEQLLEKRSFAYFTDEELFNIQREIVKLNLNLDDKLLTSPPKLLEKNYMIFTEKKYKIIPLGEWVIILCGCFLFFILKFIFTMSLLEFIVSFQNLQAILQV